MAVIKKKNKIGDRKKNSTRIDIAQQPNE